MRRTMTAALAMLALLAPAAALAHAHLSAAEPASDATVAPPDSITVHFSETITPKFSGLELKDAQGRLVPLTPRTPATGKSLISAPKSPLKPGRYTVEWHVVSADTHRVAGRYSFTVK